MSTLFLCSIIAQAETVLKTAEQLDSKSDRQLFITTLIVLVGAGAIALYWFKRALEASNARVDEIQTKHSDKMEEFHKESLARGDRLAVTLDRNTCAIEEGTQERIRTREVIENLMGHLSKIQN